MAKTRKTFRAVAFAVALVMVACIAPTVVFAENTVSLTDPTVDYASGEAIITTTGTITPGATITMLAVRSAEPMTSLTGLTDAELENALMYIDQYKTDSTSDGTKEWSFALRNSSASGDYVTVFMGGTDTAMVSKNVSLKLDPPTDLAFAATSYYVGENVEIAFTDDSAWRAAITNVTVNGTAVTNLDKNTADKISFTLAKGTYTDASVVVEATNYNNATFTGSVVVADKPAGTAEIVAYPGEQKFFIAGVDTIGLTINDSTPAGWADAVAVSVVDENNEVAGTYADGAITLTTAPTTVATYTVKFAAVDYDAVADIEFSAIAPTAVVTPAAVTLTSDDDNYYVTIPADYTDSATGASVAYTAVYDSAAFSYTGGEAATIAKAVYGTEPLKNITVTATVSKEGFESFAIEALNQDLANAAEVLAPSITAADVAILATDAFAAQLGTGYSLITITPQADVVDYTTQTVSVGDTALYYVASKGYFIGIVPTYTDAASIAADATISETASELLIYGITTEDNTDGVVGAADYIAIARLFTELDTTATAKTLIAGDVGDGAHDGEIGASDYIAIARVFTELDVSLAITAQD